MCHSWIFDLVTFRFLSLSHLFSVLTCVSFVHYSLLILVCVFPFLYPGSSVSSILVSFPMFSWFVLHFCIYWILLDASFFRPQPFSLLAFLYFVLELCCWSALFFNLLCFSRLGLFLSPAWSRSLCPLVVMLFCTQGLPESTRNENPCGCFKFSSVSKVTSLIAVWTSLPVADPSFTHVNFHDEKIHVETQGHLSGEDLHYRRTSQFGSKDGGDHYWVGGGNLPVEAIHMGLINEWK